MARRSKSDSEAQRIAEPRMVAWCAAQLGVPLQKRRITVGRAAVELDGFYEGTDRVVLVEAYARIGELRGGQPKKVLTDVLKLVFVQHRLRSLRPEVAIDVHYVFASDAAAACLTNGSWGAAAAAMLGHVKVHVASLDAETMERLLSAQQDQDIRI